MNPNEYILTQVNPKPTFTFYFLRHGYACNNLLNNKKEQNYSFKIKKDSNDFKLSKKGINETQNVKELLVQLNDKIHLIGCSPLLRCIETAHYLRYNDSKPIYVFPYLREINESNLNINSFDNYSKEYGLSEEINVRPELSMKNIKTQTEFLQNNNIRNINFDYINDKLRYEPGNIENFIYWFFAVFNKDENITTDKNILIITHSGVLRQFFMKSNKKDFLFNNNNGIKITCNNEGIITSSKIINWDVDRSRNIKDDSCDEYIDNIDETDNKKSNILGNLFKRS